MNECGVTMIEKVLNCFVRRPTGEAYKENIVSLRLLKIEILLERSTRKMH